MTTLLIADSNGTTIAQAGVPRGWTVDVYRGAQLQHVLRMLQQAKDVFSDVKTIIIAAGINDVHTPVDEILSYLMDIRDWSEKNKFKLVFTNVPVIPTLSTVFKQFIAELNQVAEDVFVHFAPVLDEKDITLKPRDSTGIHYDIATARILLFNLQRFL